MDELRLLADLNVSPATVAALRLAHLDVVRVSDLLPPTAPDEEVLALARRDGRIVVTQDLDFSALVALGGHRYPSLVTLRLVASDPATVALRLLDVLPGISADLVRGCAATIEDRAVRVRPLPIG